MSELEQAHRLFVAIEMPDELGQLAAHCQKQLKISGLVEGSYPDPKAAHLTLKFLGAVETSKIKSLVDALRTIRFDKLTLNLNSIGTFPVQSRHPHVIWLGIDGDALADLVADIEQALMFMAAPSENLFHGHLTLMRVKKVRDAVRLVEFLAAIPIPTIQFEASRFVLFESKLTQLGPKYERLAVFECSKPVAKSHQL